MFTKQFLGALMSDVPPPPPPPSGQDGAQPYQFGYGIPQKPKDYLIPAILATVVNLLFCCIPIGAVSIVYSIQSRAKWGSGDVHGATETSNSAKTWLIASAALSGILFAVFFIFGAIDGFGSSYVHGLKR